MVYLIGAGPGDPGLLTVRAARLLRRADVVIHDSLANDRLLEMAPPSAERIYVGKRGYGEQTSQAEIHRLMIEAAARAAVVVRLKGGDPFVFGRGGEEALALVDAGVPFEVVPGVTAGVGAAAYAGIPLTHRGAASAVTLVTGHSCARPSGGSGRSQSLGSGQGDETLVFYMGMKRISEIAAGLVASGRSPDTPVAVVEWGTYPFQRTVTASLRDVAFEVERAQLGAPAVIIVGEVVRLRERLSWFERRPLFGVRALVPRSRPQPSRLANALEELGANVLEAPRMELLPARDLEPLRRAVASMAGYGWVVFTSTAAVDAFWREWWAQHRDARALAGVRFACFGQTTTAALRRRGLRADVALRTYDPGEALSALEASGASPVTEPWLFPTAAGSASEIAVRLVEAGYRVDRVEAYRQVAEVDDAPGLRQRLADAAVDVVVFSASSTVHNFVQVVGPSCGRAAVVAIGPETARTALSYGLRVDLVPSEPTIGALAQGLIAWALDRGGTRGPAAGTDLSGATELVRE